MRVINVRQRSPAWERWRSEGVTASEAPVVLGRSPYKTPWRLWAERTGRTRAEDLSGNPHVQRGIAREDEARQAFERRHDTLLLPICGEADAQPVLRASFDGVNDDGEPVELKAPGEKTFAEVEAGAWGSRPVQLYLPQVQHQLYVAGAARGWLVFCGGPGRLLELPVARDEPFLTETLVPACLAFWEAVRTRTEPALDPGRDLFVPQGEALAHWTALAGEYRALDEESARVKAAAAALKAERERLEQALLGLMGGFLTGEAAGLRVTRYLQQGAVDYRAALAKLLPEVEPAALEGYRARASERVRVSVLAEPRAAVPFEAEAVAAAWQRAASESFFF
jgi:putative phage-type endonuclease